MISVNAHPPTRGREKEENGRRTYKLNIKSFTNNTNNTNNINNKRNNGKYTKLTLSSLELGASHWHPASSCQAAPNPMVIIINRGHLLHSFPTVSSV